MLSSLGTNRERKTNMSVLLVLMLNTYVVVIPSENNMRKPSMSALHMLCAYVYAYGYAL